jgi:hypothetical protein
MLHSANTSWYSAVSCTVVSGCCHTHRCLMRSMSVGASEGAGPLPMKLRSVVRLVTVAGLLPLKTEAPLSHILLVVAVVTKMYTWKPGPSTLLKAVLVCEVPELPSTSYTVLAVVPGLHRRTTSTNVPAEELKLNISSSLISVATGILAISMMVQPTALLPESAAHVMLLPRLMWASSS